MSTKTPELSAAHTEASIEAARTDPVRICHYGTGRSGASPVLLHLPRTLGHDHPVPVTQRFADEFRWLYERGLAGPANLAEFHREITWSFERGDFERARSATRSAQSHWRNQTAVPYFDYPGYANAEEEYLDQVGRIARFADLPESFGEAYSSFWSSHWGNYIEVPHRRRAAVRIGIVGVLASASIALAVAVNPPWICALLVAWMPWRTRFRYSSVERLSLFKWATLEYLPDPEVAENDAEKVRYKKLRQEHAEAILGRDDAFAFDRACAVVRDEVVENWAEAARKEVEEKAAPLRKELAAAEAAAAAPDPTRGKGAMLGRALGTSEEGSVLAAAPKHDLLRASEALIAEFDDRDAAKVIS